MSDVITHENIMEMPLAKHIAKHPKKYMIGDPHGWPHFLYLNIYNPYEKKFRRLCDIRQGECVNDLGRPYIETCGYFLDTSDGNIVRVNNDSINNGHVDTYSDDRALFATRGIDKTWFDTMTPKQLDEHYERFLDFFKKVDNYKKEDKKKRQKKFPEVKADTILAAKEIVDMAKYLLTQWKKAKCTNDYELLREIDDNWYYVREAKNKLKILVKRGEKLSGIVQPTVENQPGVHK